MLKVAENSVPIFEKPFRPFEGELLIRAFTLTLIQIFCEVIFDFQVIVKIVIDPDVNFKNTSWALIG